VEEKSAKNVEMVSGCRRYNRCFPTKT